MARQLALGLPHRPAMSREDYLVGRSNEAAVAAVDAWPAWPFGALVLVGPAGSGKSHLAAIWAERAGALRREAPELDETAVPTLAQAGSAVLEDCDRGVDEAALFHLLNEFDRAGRFLLLTARGEPATWGLSLPDLRSRLSRLPSVRLGAPDDALVEALVVKHFADRQLAVEPGVLRYMLPRIERSFAGIAEAVARLDAASIEEKRPVTRALAARILKEDPER